MSLTFCQKPFGAGVGLLSNRQNVQTGERDFCKTGLGFPSVVYRSDGNLIHLIIRPRNNFLENILGAIELITGRAGCKKGL